MMAGKRGDPGNAVAEGKPFRHLGVCGGEMFRVLHSQEEHE